MGKKEKVNKNKGGRPTAFKDEYVELAYNYCLLGATDSELASFFGVVESTINKWKKDHSKFSESIKKGKEQADALIARRLFDRAYGATIKTQQAFKVKNVSWQGDKRVETETIEIVELQQEQVPDTTAAIFWLKNRRPNAWRDKQVTEHEGEVNVRTAPLTKQQLANRLAELEKGI